MVDLDDSLPEEMSLRTLGAGAAVELFDVELQRVLDNIIDPNTDPKAKRSVTLTVTFRPDEERETGKVLIQASSKLAGMRGHPGRVFIGSRRGRGVAYEDNPQQRRLACMSEPTKAEAEAEADGKLERIGGER